MRRGRVAVALLGIACAVGPPERAPTAASVPAVAHDPTPVLEPPRSSEQSTSLQPRLSGALARGFADACGSCHDSALGTAKPEALAVFDLADPDWLVALTPERRQCTLDRLGSKDFVADAAKTDLARIVADLRDG